MELPESLADLVQQASCVRLVVDNAKSPSNPVSETVKLNSSQRQRQRLRPGRVNARRPTTRSRPLYNDSSPVKQRAMRRVYHHDGHDEDDVDFDVPTHNNRWEETGVATTRATAAASIDDEDDAVVRKRVLTKMGLASGGMRGSAATSAARVPLSPALVMRSRWENAASAKSAIKNEPPIYSARTSPTGSSPSKQQKPKAPLVVPVRHPSLLDIPITRSS